MAVIRFPHAFNFGASILAKVDEGGGFQGNKGLSTYDVVKEFDQVDQLDLKQVLAAVDDVNLAAYPTRTGADFYHQLAPDLQALAKLGVNQVLVSLSWARLFPKGEELSPNEAGLKFYQILLEKINAVGLEPIVVLGDGALPLNLSIKYNGWATRRVVADFNRYANVCFDNFGHLVKYWVTFSDVSSVLTSPYLGGGVLLNQTDMELKYQAFVHQLLASALVSKNLHEQYPDSKLGYGLSYQVDLSGGTRAYEQNFHQRLLADFILKGKYSPLLVASLDKEEIELDLDEMDVETIADSQVDFIQLDWQATENLTAVLLELAERYQLPIIVCDCSVDLQANLGQIGQALARKVEVAGYFPVVFGKDRLLAVDAEFLRKPTDTYRTYQELVFERILKL